MTWLSEARRVIDHYESRQGAALDAAGALCGEAIASDRVVHLFGSGHSRMPVEEMFPRYGSFPGFVPHVELSLTNYAEVTGSNGLRQVLMLERMEGFGSLIAEEARIAPEDVVIVFSVSGTNAVPLEFAETARETGAGVVAVTNLLSHVPNRRSIADVAHVVVDLGVPPGDAVTRVSGWSAPIGPLSTFSYVCAVNLLRIRTAEYLSEREIVLPVITHPSKVGVDGALKSMSEVLAEHDRRTRTGPNQ